MERIDTSDLGNWPNEILLASSDMGNTEGIEILSKEELKKYRSFKSEGRRSEFLNSRKLFRFLLEEMGVKVSDSRILKYKKGKPYGVAGNSHIFVSFTHTPEKVFCAVSQNSELGLDSELISREIPEKVLNRILNDKEKESLQDVDPVIIWTIKEAAVKFSGTGLGTHMDDHTIVKTKKNKFSVRFNDDKLIEICSFRQSDHQIALAYYSKHI